MVPLNVTSGMLRSKRARSLGVHALACAAWMASPPTARAQSGDPINYETARLERRLPATRASAPIELDGVLDEAAWVAAPVAKNFVQNDPREGEPATYDTEVRVLYDDEAVYFGVFARDAEPSAIIVNDLKKDFNTGSSDGFRVIIDTFADQRNGYQFAVNPAGAKWDAQMSNEGRENNSNWDGIWDVQTRITETGWYAEIRIPLRTLKFTERDLQSWGLNFERKLRRLNEDSYWSPLPRIYSLERVSLAGTIDGMRGLRPGLNIRVKPYGLASSNTVGPSAADGDFDAGVDVKYGVTTGLTWDFTVNTDFSQVEADEQQVNLSRFSLFFPEKRDFFLENSGIFQFGDGGGGGGGGGGFGGRQNGSQPMRLFFSRRIGLSGNGTAIPILAGTRLTGRVGKNSVGLLNIQQRALDPVPWTNFTALRMQRDVLANSDVGVVLLNKEQDGSHFNRVAGVDANFRFGFLSMSAYGAKTFSPTSAVPGTGEDFTARAAVNYQSRRLQLRGHYNAIGQRFNDEMGFVPRVGVDNVLLYGGWAFRPAWASRLGIREIRPHWQLDAFRRRDGLGLESQYQDWHLPFNFHDGAFIEVGVNPNVEEIRQSFTINSALGVTVPAGHYEFNEYFFLWRSNDSAPFSWEARFSTGDFYDGYRRAYTFGPSARVSEHFNASVSLQINDIDLSTGAYVSKLVSSRLNYNFNTKMFLNALLQYSTDSRQWSSNIRFNLIHRPLSDVFIVYNERRLDGSGDLIDRAVIGKMTYMMAF
jgi:uncharacterized protein DUF5916/cellulose/xylan binding protein with CBM9 domain